MIRETLYTYTCKYTVLSQASAHTRASAHPPILTVLWFFKVLYVTPTMLNSCALNSKVDPLSSHSCDCALDATTSGIKGWHTLVHGLVRSVLSLQHEICVLQVTTERCRNLATRLQVSQLCSMIQLSPLSGWPRQSTKRRCCTPWQFTSHPGLHGDS